MITNIMHNFNEVMDDLKNKRHETMRGMRIKALESALVEKKRLEAELSKINLILSEAELKNNFTNLLNKYCPEYMGIAEDFFD